MAKSEARIRMDYARASECAARLEYTAHLIRQGADNSLGHTLAAIGAAWKGEGADIFTGKGQRLRGQIQDQAKELERTAQTIREIAKNTYTAEMRAREIIEQKDYR